MIFRLDLQDDVPIYEQIVRQVVSAVADGLLQPGELVPSVREVSRELLVNPNTVQRAYRQLQDQGILQPVRGTGLAVAEGVRERCRRQRDEFVRRRLESALRDALRSGITPQELKTMLRDLMATLNGQEHRRSERPEQGGGAS